MRKVKYETRMTSRVTTWAAEQMMVPFAEIGNPTGGVGRIWNN